MMESNFICFLFYFITVTLHRVCLTNVFAQKLLVTGLILVQAVRCAHDHTTFHVDKSTYEEGKKQYEIILRNAELPNYGQCWKDVIIFTESGCQRLTDDMQARLALAYLNCFLGLQGRPKYECDETQAFRDCTRSMQDSDRNSMTVFFTHTQNICYFLRVQVWNEVTESTISELAKSSVKVASQLQESSQLQIEMIKQQNQSLSNQQILIKNADNLSHVLSSSSEEINRLFNTFKETTQEQRLLITDVFEQLTSLKKTMLGEFSGFYSILYYFFSVLLCYLLTSARRTSDARFWLFSIMTISVLCEYLMTFWALTVLTWVAVQTADHDAWVYWLCSTCRKLWAVVAVVVLALCAYNHCDLNQTNHLLLMEIRKQNSDLKRLMSRHPDVIAVGPASENNYTCTTTDDRDTESETGSRSSDSDRTYILQENEELSSCDSDSYFTAETLQGGSHASTNASRQNSLLQELRDLRCSTPLKEMAGQMEQWISTGVYTRLRSPGSLLKAGSGDAAVGVSFGGSPYLLRPRHCQPSGVRNVPAAEVESPRSFAKTVRQLERIAKRNGQIVCASVQKPRGK